MPTLFVSPFTLEIDHPRNCNVVMRSLDNLKLLSAFNGMKPATDRRGRQRVPVDQANTFAAFPQLPGHQIAVNPAELTFRVSHPLHEPTGQNERLLEELVMWFRENQGISMHSKPRAPEPIEGRLDEHQMKTLCRECRWLLDEKHARVISGPPSGPRMEEIDQLPGKYILDVGAITPSSRPRYEEDLQKWVDKLASLGQ